MTSGPVIVPCTGHFAAVAGALARVFGAGVLAEGRFAGSFLTEGSLADVFLAAALAAVALPAGFVPVSFAATGRAAVEPAGSVFPGDAFVAAAVLPAAGLRVAAGLAAGFRAVEGFAEAGFWGTAFPVAALAAAAFEAVDPVVAVRDEVVRDRAAPVCFVAAAVVRFAAGLAAPGFAGAAALAEGLEEVEVDAADLVALVFGEDDLEPPGLAAAGFPAAGLRFAAGLRAGFLAGCFGAPLLASSVILTPIVFQICRP